jgi:hypothetical protein
MLAVDGGAETGRIFDVFVSYAREDVNRLAATIAFLEGRGYSVFWDKRLLAGRDWQDQLRTEIKLARKVLALWSAAASASHGEEKLVPLWLADCARPWSRCA